MWAIRRLAFSQHDEQMTLVIEDPGGEILDQFLPGLEIKQFLRFAIGLSTALSGVHKMQLIHKDVKPANVLC
jgi:serine/threonine protein kinase